MDSSLNRTAFSATWHCLTGCAIGEILGMVLSTMWGWPALPSVILAVTLAFIFGYLFTIVPLMRHGMEAKKAAKTAFVADTASITIMEITDNAFILAVPGAIHAGLSTAVFWVSLGLSLVMAFIVAFPLNRWMISRGKGHAVVHEHHHSLGV